MGILDPLLADDIIIYADELLEAVAPDPVAQLVAALLALRETF